MRNNEGIELGVSDDDINRFKVSDKEEWWRMNGIELDGVNGMSGQIEWKEQGEGA